MLCECNEGNYPAARARFTQSLAIIRDFGEQWGTALTVSFLGEVTYKESDYPAAQALHEEGLTIFRKLGDRLGVASALGSLARVARSQGDYLGARARYQESLAIQRELGDRRGVSASLTGLAYVALALGLSEAAARILGGVERLREEIHMPLRPNEQPDYERSVAAARMSLGGGAAFDRAWQEGRALTLEQAIAFALEEPVERP